MKKLILIYTIILSLFISNVDASWRAICLPTFENLNAIDFYGQDTGLIVGNNGTILKTIDGGQSWSPISTAFTNHLTDVQFVTADTVYASGYGSLVIKSTDGGETWISAKNGLNNNLDLFSIYFTNSTKGFVAGKLNTGSTPCNNGCWTRIRATDDGAENWNLQDDKVIPTPPTGDLHHGISSVFFTDDTTGYFVANGINSGRAIVKTTNAGTDWIKQNDSLVIPGITRYKYADIYFINSDTGFAIGYYQNNSGTSYAYVLKTTNGGTIWNIASPTGGVNMRLKSIYFTDENNGYIIGNQWTSTYPYVVGGLKIYHTTDGGSNWNLLTYGTLINPSIINDIYMLNSSKAYIVGGNGTLLINEPTSFNIDFYNEAGDTIACNEPSLVFHNCSSPEYSAPPYNSCSNKYVWYVNGDSVSIDHNLEYQFDSGGVYNIKLKVTSFCQSINPSLIDSLEKQIFVSGNPEASFSGNIDTVSIGSTLELISTSLYADMFNWAISFNGESIESIYDQSNLNYTFNQLGNYTVLLEAVNTECNNKDYALANIFVDSNNNETAIKNEFSFSPIFNVYPNPSKGDIEISIVQKENQNIKLEVLDIKGNSISSNINSSFLDNGVFKISINSPGIYVAKVLIEGQSFYKKFFIVD